MNLFKALRAKVAATVSHPSPNSWFRFLLPNTKVDYARKVGDGLGSNVFMAPVLWISRAWIEARLAVITVSKEGEQVDTQHVLAQLLRQPNPAYSGAALWLATMISWFSNGNAYWLKVRDRSGKVRQLWYTPHWLIEPIVREGSDDFISYYRYCPGVGRDYELDPADVVHLRHGVDPRNVRKGLSLMGILLREIFNDDEAANFVAGLLSNSGVPGLIISPKDANSASPESLQETKRYLKDQFSGDLRGDPLALGAPTEIKEFGYDPAKMNVDVVRNVSEERVCAVLGVPAAVVGFGAGMEQTKVGATLIELHRIAWIDCLIPNQDMLGMEITRCFREDFRLAENQEVGFDRRRVRALQEDVNKESERQVREVAAGVRMVSEARRALNLPVTPADEVYLRPFSAVETGPGAPEPVVTPAAATPAAAVPAKQLKGHRRLSKRQALIVQMMDRLKQRSQRRLKMRMDDFFGRFGQAAHDAYLNAAKADDEELRIESMFGSMNVPKFKSELRGIFGSHFVSVHNETAGALAGFGLGINLPDSIQLEVLANGGTRAGLVDLDEAAKARVFEIVRQGREEGRGPIDIARDLRSAVPGGPFKDPNYRAELIARTETREAQTSSALRCYEKTDGIDGVIILDARLAGETDQDCEDMDGTPMNFIEARAALADEHPNGTRDLAPAFAQES